ncbi:MAG: plastocyanin/azurin family copper-binding protein, partial [Alphaproteobacteria bacterium]
TMRSPIHASRRTSAVPLEPLFAVLGAVLLAVAIALPALAGERTAVEIKKFKFGQESIEVPAGATVVWSNGDGIDHSVTHGTPGALGGAFDSGLMTKGKSYEQTFTQTGEYPYFCKRHEFMTGVVKVVRAN